MSNIEKYTPQPTQAVSIFNDQTRFEHAQRIAKMLATSDLVPENYRGNMANSLVALEMAGRVGASPLMVMQNLHVIQGRPSWSSSFVIASLNSCGRFEPLRFKIEDLGQKEVTYEFWDGPKGQRQRKTGKAIIQDRACTAWTRDRDGNVLEGPPVSIEMAVNEGWYTKQDSKWKTMPDLMLRYRSAKFFGNLYAPDVLMGMNTQDELVDIGVAPAEILSPLPFGNDETAPAMNPIDSINATIAEQEPAKATRKGKVRQAVAPDEASDSVSASVAVTDMGAIADSPEPDSFDDEEDLI
jgi:hypothetical protein